MFHRSCLFILPRLCRACTLFNCLLPALPLRASGNVKRISLELGGNAPFIVFSDADISAAVEGVSDVCLDSARSLAVFSQGYIADDVHRYLLLVVD